MTGKGGGGGGGGGGGERMLHGLRNLISSSAHSGVVRGHVELQSLGSTFDDEKLVRLKLSWEFQGRD